MNEAVGKLTRWYKRPTTLPVRIAWIVACALIGLAIGTVAVWIVSGDVYLKFQL